jgi:hypothetical protein
VYHESGEHVAGSDLDKPVLSGTHHDEKVAL